MRPIDADKLKKCVLKWLPKDPCGIEEKEMPFETDICVSMLMEIDEQPTIQPEIIYCKDCKHHWTYKCMDSMPIERCDLEQTFYDAEIDFCSLAERREVTT